MLRCRNKREKVEKCGRVPAFPQKEAASRKTCGFFFCMESCGREP